jgi:N-acylethanolamine-hydrolysing acid amidase
MKLVVVFLFFSTCLNFGFFEELKFPKRYKINLDLPPEERWNQVIDDHMDAIPYVVNETKSYVPEALQKPLFWLAEKISVLFEEDYVREMKAIANRTGLPFGEIAGLNILYDITSFNRHIFAPFACTSIIAEDSKGRIYHGRNLDYDMGDLLRNVTIIADFTRNGTILFSTPTFALYVGVLTAQKPNAYAVSLNARYSGGYVDNILMEIITMFKNPVSFDLRTTLETKHNYSDAIEHLSRVHFVAPSYLIVSGTKSGQGVVITRNRWSTADMYSLNPAKGRWFLVETNFDRWKKPGDDRRDVAKKYLTELKRDNLNSKTLFTVLGKGPINNNLTIFSTVMSAAKPEIFYQTTTIRMK